MAQQPSIQHESATQRKSGSAEAVIGDGKSITPEVDPSEPRPMWYFFYGTLMNPSRLASITGLEELSDVIQAEVHHVKLRYWGRYPVLVSGKTGAVVKGAAWFAPSVEVINRLRYYETTAYYDAFVKIVFKNGEEVTGRAFKWAGDEEDLSDVPRI